MRRLLAVSLLFAAMATTARAGRAGESPLEPPPEAPEGMDYEVETADSIEVGSLEMGFGATGRAGRPAYRRQSLRFSGDGLNARLREGGGDPLAGGALEAGALGGRLGAGRLRPRWGRGLLLGASPEPWARPALAGDRPPLRVHSGEGLWYRRGNQSALGLIAGRFARHDLAGASFERGGFGLAAMAARIPRSTARRRRQASLWWERAAVAGELALDGAGRWRAEGTMQRARGGLHLIANARAGLEGFRSLAEPRRAGPSRALAAGLVARAGPTRFAALGALWRYRAGYAGARGALEVERDLAQHDALALGFEEQQGIHRDPAESGSRIRSGSFRQGLWGQWRGARPALAMVVRQEVWGERRFARGAVRTVSAVRIEAAAPRHAVLRVTHTVYRARSGESLYLAETRSDRLVLRAVSGAGERTRVEVEAPAGGGTVRAALDFSATQARAARPQWTLDWTRRARTR